MTEGYRNPYPIRHPYKKGDRIEYVGLDEGPPGPAPGERGTVADVDPMDDHVYWDVTGPMTLSLAGYPVRLVTDEDDEPT